MNQFKHIIRHSVKPLRSLMFLLSTLTLLAFMTGCGKKYVVVQGNDNISITKAELDTLKSDNEALLGALLQCKGGK